MDDATTTLPAALAAHAADHPEEPWLFFRRGEDWGWRSWSQVAHQVACGADVLQCSAAFAASRRVAYADRADPDTVALILAIQAAGGAAVAMRGRTGAGVSAAAVQARVEASESSSTEHGAHVVVLPAAPSRLTRWTPDLETLRHSMHRSGSAGAADAFPSCCELWRAAREWEAGRRAIEGQPCGRPVVLASAAAEPSVWPKLLAWTLLTGAAWVLESEAESFVPAVLRNRPTWVLAPGTDAGLLVLSLKERPYRRWHRLRSVGVTDDAPAEIVLEDEWRSLGVPLMRLDGQDLPPSIPPRGPCPSKGSKRVRRATQSSRNSKIST